MSNQMPNETVRRLWVLFDAAKDICEQETPQAWCVLYRAVADVAESDRPVADFFRACRGGDTIAGSETDGTALAECVACGMFVRADQVEHVALGFKARCEGSKS